MSLIATCHCGATRIELPHPPVSAGECNCTYCSRTGAVWGYYKPGEMKIISTEGERIYSPSGMNNHHFCGTCGMQTWGDTPDWGSIYNADGTPKPGFEAGGMPTERSYAVNLRLIDDFDWTSIEVEQMDGRNSW
nr:hypothetical protein [uncultured Devosia sp.]